MVKALSQDDDPLCLKNQYMIMMFTCRLHCKLQCECWIPALQVAHFSSIK